jgi:acyl-CoA thioesterase FadM
MYIYLLIFVLLVIAFFDLYWILRLIMTRLLSKVLPCLTLGDEGVIYSLCWTTDLDYFFHMNNGKYFREMDFARFDFYFRTGCSAYIEARSKMFVVQHGASIRYRRSIDAFVPFKVVTRLIYWDERSLYFEQSFVSLHDGFVRAVALCKNTVVGGSVVQMLASLGVEHVPEMPKEVELWLASQEITSSRLRSSNTKETTSDGVQKHITKEPLDGSYLNNSDCISSTTVQQEEASHDEDVKIRLNLVGPSCSTEAVVSSTTPSCQTEKSKDL